LGLLVGDALGVPYEFSLPEDIPPPEQIEFAPPSGFFRAHDHVPPGTWSDDGAQALCLLASLLERGRFDAHDFARRLLDWHERGYLAVDGDVFDIGIQTERALHSLKAGVTPLEAGPAGEHEQGNGFPMRVLPLALWHRGSDAELAADAALQSRLTHGHPRTQVCCALYCLWARRVLDGPADRDAWEAAVAAAQEIYPPGSRERAELEDDVLAAEKPNLPGGGYVVDCLRSARAVMVTGDYEQVVKAAVALGNDTDTTACVAGGIAGIRDGVGAIPARWRDGLRARGLVHPLLSRLLAKRG
jgi:ADP-ribosylglycohydrolase